MKKLLSTLALLISTQAFSATELSVGNCQENNISLNAIYSMKTFSNSSVKVFEVDMEEPASAPVGIAVAINRGTDLSNSEVFCRYIPGLSSAALAKVKSSFNANTNTIVLVMPASVSDGQGQVLDKTLTIMIKKGAKDEAGLVKASLK